MHGWRIRGAKSGLLSKAALRSTGVGLPLLALIALGLSVVPAKQVATVGPASAGAVQIEANTGWMGGTLPSASNAWMSAHYSRTLAYNSGAPSWYHGAWYYEDTYSGGNGDPILKDSHGNDLCIPWGANNQPAADPGSPVWRATYINRAQSAMANGYHGIFMDDMNLNRSGYGNGIDVGACGSGTAVDPIDPRTGAPMTLNAWESYMTGMAQAMRVALPNAEIVHNTPPNEENLSDSNVQGEIKASDVLEFEHAQYYIHTDASGFNGLLAKVDYANSVGSGVDFSDGDATTNQAESMYLLGTYFLVSNGNDFVQPHYNNVQSNWWSGYDVQLGAPLDSHYVSNGLYRRDYQCGSVFVNPQGSPTQTVSLSGSFRDLNSGATVTTETVSSNSAAIAVSSGCSVQRPTPTPTPTPTSTHTSTPTPTGTPITTPTPTPSSISIQNAVCTVTINGLTQSGTCSGQVSQSGGGCPPTVQQGSTGNTVKQLQTDLNKNGASLSVDGDDGPVTTAALQNYQSSHGLTADGIAWPSTWHKLGEC
jgi:hypothetical protein